MHTILKYSLAALTLSTSMVGVADAADAFISCKSNNYRHTICPLPRPGLVYIKYQVSQTKCLKGINWGYNRANIWVDDGCAAKFGIKYNQDYSRNNHTRDALGAIAGIAVLGALAHKSDRYSKYNDPNYRGPQHSSYIPRWMIGTFKGYNEAYNMDVRMTIRADGSISARSARGTHLTGFVNNGELHIGSEVVDIRRTKNGFVTNHHGDYSSPVRYHRVAK